MATDADRKSSRWVTLAKVVIICAAAVFLSIFAYHLSPDVRRWVVKLQSRRGPAAVPALLWHYKDKESLVWLAARDSLCEMGAEAAPALVVALAGDEEPRTRADAAKVLGLLGPKASAAVADLTKALTDADPDVRKEAAESLGKIGPEARGSVAALVKLLDDPTGRVRARACESISELSEADETTAKLMIRLLINDPDEEVRAEAAEALGRFGESAKDNQVIWDALMGAAFKDSNFNVRKEAGGALNSIDPAKAPRPDEILSSMPQK